MILLALVLCVFYAVLGWWLEKRDWTIPAVLCLTASIFCLTAVLVKAAIWISGQP